MRKKFFVGCISVMCMGLMLAGCGKKKDDDKQDKTTTESSSEETTSEDTSNGDATSDVDFDKYISYTIDTSKIEISAVNDGYLWVLETYGYPNVKVDTTEDDINVKYTVTPVSKTEDFPIIIEAVGNGANETLIVSFEISIDDKNEMTCNVTRDVFPTENNQPGGNNAPVDEDLGDITNAVLGSIPETELPSIETAPISIDDSDMIEHALGVKSLDGLEAVADTEPMMSSIAFSLVVLRFDTEENAQKSVDILTQNAPVNKWVCVTPDTVKVRTYNGNYVIMIMGSQVQADAVTNLK